MLRTVRDRKIPDIGWKNRIRIRVRVRIGYMGVFS